MYTCYFYLYLYTVLIDPGATMYTGGSIELIMCLSISVSKVIKSEMEEAFELWLLYLAYVGTHVYSKWLDFDHQVVEHSGSKISEVSFIITTRKPPKNKNFKWNRTVERWLVQSTAKISAHGKKWRPRVGLAPDHIRWPQVFTLPGFVPKAKNYPSLYTFLGMRQSLFNFVLGCPLVAVWGFTHVCIGLFIKVYHEFLDDLV